jgi:hypothetical protein
VFAAYGTRLALLFDDARAHMIDTGSNAETCALADPRTTALVDGRSRGRGDDGSL